jgi:hypothetical protein
LPPWWTAIRQQRGAALPIHLDRRKSRDDRTRAKLTPSLTEAFLDERMPARAGAVPRFRSAAAG